MPPGAGGTVLLSKVFYAGMMSLNSLRQPCELGSKGAPGVGAVDPCYSKSYSRSRSIDTTGRFVRKAVSDPSPELLNLSAF